MRACRIIAATAGLCLSLVFGTIEATATVSAVDLSTASRSWVLTIIVVAAIAFCTLAIIERQSSILDRLDEIERAKTGRSQARAELDALQRRMRNNGGNITPLYPEE